MPIADKPRCQKCGSYTEVGRSGPFVSFHCAACNEIVCSHEPAYDNGTDVWVKSVWMTKDELELIYPTRPEPNI